jgi:DNA invertase Pin-like site-specific DNA recombinase
MKYISYCRISRLKQRNGEKVHAIDDHSLYVQKEDAVRYAESHGGVVIAEYQEVETGKMDKRPVLVQALEHCKSENAVLLVAKIDRLSRNEYFLQVMDKAGVEFVCLDNPHATRFTLSLMLLLASEERERIVARIKMGVTRAREKRGEWRVNNLNDEGRKQAGITKKEDWLSKHTNAIIMAEALKNASPSITALEIAMSYNNTAFANETGCIKASVVRKILRRK